MGKKDPQLPNLLGVRKRVVAGPVFKVTAFACSQSWSSDLYGPTVNVGLSPCCDGCEALQCINNGKSLVSPFIKKESRKCHFHFFKKIAI